jgi:SAM-dependent methyltransferase
LARARPAGDFDYEAHGPHYASIRRPDPRIAALILSALGPGGPARSVLNVGAGAGSYEPVDRAVTAVEPSATMRAQRPPGLVEAIDATAEALPFADDSVDAAMATVTVHQWTDWAQGLREMRRVSRGPVVVMTFDGDALDRLWLAQYAPELMTAERRRYPAIDAIEAVLGGSIMITPVPIPLDCQDGFTEAYFGRPEAFLDPGVRAAQSAWGFIEPAVADQAVARLRADLESGEWDRRFGALRTQPEFIGALRLIVAHP